MALLGELGKIFIKSIVAVGGVHAGNGIVQKVKENRAEKKKKDRKKKLSEMEEIEE